MVIDKKNGGRNVKITTDGIKSVLGRMAYSQDNIYKSIVEYIWNGFDAKATVVEVDIEIDVYGVLKRLEIKDNGTGISQEQLAIKFDPFFQSDKVLAKKMERHSSEFHGRRGIGRLTFFTFANFANWSTAYQKASTRYKYDIEISANTLEKYNGLNAELQETKQKTGTTVRFSGFLRGITDSKTYDELLDYLKREFCWYLELNKEHNYQLVVNGEDLDYNDIIGDSKDFEITCGEPKKAFKVRYFRWNMSLTDEYSKFYYIGSDKNEKYKENTRLNNQGDDFFHSVYISSDYFDEFNFYSAEDPAQTGLGLGRSDQTFKYFSEAIYVFLRKERKPFLKQHSEELVAGLEKEHIIEPTPKTEIELIQTTELKSVVRGMYELQPKIFSSLNQEQKKTFVNMVKLILETEERDRLMEIVEKVVELDPADRKELAELLRVTKLTSIINTINMIKNRFLALELLKKMNFDKGFGANEIEHLQGEVENNTWIFGEQYHLIAAAEDDFEKALRNYRKEIFKETEVAGMTHPDKKGQVDIFIVRQRRNGIDEIHNIIIELKHPQKSLGETELSQVKKYMRVIQSESRFNGDTFSWEYILVGTHFDKGGFIEGELKSSQHYGETGLVHNQDNHKIYVRKWSDVINLCELRHQFLNDKLELKKKELTKDIRTADDVLKLRSEQLHPSQLLRI
jgi:hypothetical protein